MPDLSAVAGIVDKGGGLRVVVTQPWLLGHHVGPGEKLFILPETLVQEPVSLEKADSLIEAVQAYVASQL